MRSVWSFLADNAFHNICDFIYVRFGYKAKNDYVMEVDTTIHIVAEHPNIGKPELELARDGSVRSITIRKLSKMIYFVEDDILYIADVWDTRQDPEALAARFAE